MKAAVALLSLSVGLSAQVSVRFTPEPMIVPSSVLASAKDMGRWSVQPCNDGPVPIALQWERINQAAGEIKFIDPEDAILVLSGHQRKTVAARVVHYGGIAAQVLSIGLALSSRANLRWSTGLSVGASVAPAFIQIAEGQIPAVAPLDSGVKYPVTLEPGDCFTDHRFAAKMRGARVRTATISITQPSPFPPAVPRPIEKSALKAILNGCVKVYEDGKLTEDTCRQPSYELSAQVDVRSFAK